MNQNPKNKITESLQEQLPLFSTPESHYIFKGPPTLSIKSAVKGQKNYCTLDHNCWSWMYGGNLTNLDWTNYNLNPNLKEILKAFIFHRLQTLSPATVSNSDYSWLMYLSNNTELQVAFPWDTKDFFLKLLSLVKMEREVFYGFKAFYKFGFARGFSGFTKEYNDIIEETPNVQQNNSQYQKVLLQQFNRLSSADESILLDYIYTPVGIEDYSAFRDNIILHMAFELAPRPIQMHSLSIEDLEVVESASKKEHYFSLWLPMAKKRNTNDIEKRYRKITASLGEKIMLLVHENKRLYGDAPHFPLFVNPRIVTKNDGREGRLGTNVISIIICRVLQSRGFKKGDGATLLRHHLAQSLADQGASAETIAEILGHNSTLPARAYIAATPAIATIKTRALGKNKTYENIMSMLLTGKIIEKETAGKGKWVKGMIGNQYIGGIGACGLPENTSCPKNPVYACYTCAKFHPFRDGTHNEVKESLQKQVQYFIDIAEAAMDLQHNRTYLQLERTIEAVDAVIHKIESEQ